MSIRIVTAAEIADSCHAIPGSDRAPYALALGRDIVLLCTSLEDAQAALAEAHRRSERVSARFAETGDFYAALEE